MKKLLLVALVLFAVPALAQETYSIVTPAANVLELTAVVTASNERVCFAQALALTCTQAQACTSAGAGGGAACTSQQARNAAVRIYPLTQAGREEFVIFQIAAPKFAEMKAQIITRGLEKLCSFWTTASQGQRDALCTSSGQSAGCLLCP